MTGFKSKCKNAEHVHTVEGMMQISSLVSNFSLVPKFQGISVTDKSVNDKGLQAVLTVSLSCGHCQEGSECSGAVRNCPKAMSSTLNKVSAWSPKQKAVHQVL